MLDTSSCSTLQNAQCCESIPMQFKFECLLMDFWRMPISNHHLQSLPQVPKLFQCVSQPSSPLIWDVCPRLRCLPTVQPGYQKKVFVHLSLLGARFCHSPKTTPERKLSLLYPQLPWEWEVGPLMSQTVTKSHWVRWTRLFTAVTSVSKTFPKLWVLVMFKQYGSVFLTLRCLILECSEAKK